MDFIDLQRSSGTAYRFRRWPESGAHPPIAGNYVLVAADARTVVEIGVLDNLVEAPRLLADRHSGAELFTRFDIARIRREAEHADLVLGHPELGATAFMTAPENTD